jgi:hypothetical protein
VAVNVACDRFEAVEERRDLVEYAKYGFGLAYVHDKYVVILTD